MLTLSSTASVVFASDLAHAIQLELLSIDPPGMGGDDMQFHFEVLSTGAHGGAVPEPGTVALLAAGGLVGVGAWWRRSPNVYSSFPRSAWERGIGGKSAIGDSGQNGYNSGRKPLTPGEGARYGNDPRGGRIVGLFRGDVRPVGAVLGHSAGHAAGAAGPGPGPPVRRGSAWRISVGPAPPPPTPKAKTAPSGSLPTRRSGTCGPRPPGGSSDWSGRAG